MGSENLLTSNKNYDKLPKPSLLYRATEELHVLHAGSMVLANLVLEKKSPCMSAFEQVLVFCTTICMQTSCASCHKMHFKDVKRLTKKTLIIQRHMIKGVVNTV